MDFEKTASGFKVSGSIVKITSKTAKGGAVQFMVESPLNPEIAKEAYSHLEKVGTVSFEYKEQPVLDFGDETPTPGSPQPRPEEEDQDELYDDEEDGVDIEMPQEEGEEL